MDDRAKERERKTDEILLEGHTATILLTISNPIDTITVLVHFIHFTHSSFILMRAQSNSYLFDIIQIKAMNVKCIFCAYCTIYGYII